MKSHAALDRSVQSMSLPDQLDPQRLEWYNYRLNENGRRITLRMRSDNEHALLTQPGFNISRSLGLIKVIEHNVENVKTKMMEVKKNTVIEKENVQRFFQEYFYKIVDLRIYPVEIAQMYSKVSKISWRSIFKAKKYMEVLNTYGHNREKILDPVTARKLVNLLDQHFRPWITNPLFEFDLGEELNSGRWLTHIKTNSNSGYPANIKQSKQLMATAAAASLKIFNSWKKGEKIDWHKLSFEMGYRTERDGKHRVICMAAQYEKPLSAVISTMLDLTAESLPFNLPRKFGHFKNVAAEIFKISNGRLFSKDFEGFDTSVPINLFVILRNWFKSINNTMALLIAFELDLIIHSFMIIDPVHAFWIAALPSGIGITQFIGSLIHWLIDLIIELECLIAFYQSDDNICITNLDDNELKRKMAEIKEKFGMDVAPVGEKSFIAENYNKFLQKIIDRKLKIYYNHEQRAFTNAIFREREISDDTLFDQLFMLDGSDKENKSKKAVLAYLGNLVSFGQYAPSLAPILSALYGRHRTGFTTTQIKWGLTNIEKYMKEYLEVEQHRPLEDTGWCSGILNACLNQYGWTNLTPEQIRNAARLNNIHLYTDLIVT